MMRPNPVLSTAPSLVLGNHITEAAFLRVFPLVYDVKALTPWQAFSLGLSNDRTWWIFQQPFTFVSDTWGPVNIPAGFITDFASVPLALRSIYDCDAPILLYPSAPHDFLFTPRADGTRGWLPDGRRLSLRQVNNVLTEAMWYCGASTLDRSNVFMAVEIGNESIRGQFAPDPA